MAILESDIINALTVKLGNPSESEYSEISKLSSIRRALVHYSEYKPLKKIGKFTSVVGVQQYDIGSSYAYLVGISEVFYGANVQNPAGFYNNIYDKLVNSVSDFDINNESIRVINDQVRSVIEKSTRYDYEMIDDNVVALIPTPEEVLDVYFSYDIIKTVDDLRESEFEDIVDFSFIISATDLANKRHKILQVNEPGTGFVMFQGGRFLEEQVEKTRIRLMKRLGVSSLAIHG